MRNSKTRVLAWLLALALVAGILPAVKAEPAKASEIIRYEACYQRTYLSVRYLDSIRVAINPDNGLADMTFKRKILFEDMQRYMESEVWSGPHPIMEC